MNGAKLSFLILSLPAVVALFPYSVANAGLRISNSSLIKNQAQINAERAIDAANVTATTAAAAQIQTPQPARTFTDNNGATVSVSDQDMQACSAIYPNGHFDWKSPTTGRYRGSSPMCSALIELRSYKNAAGNAYSVLAYAYLGAGDSMKCNIDEFTELTPQGKDYEYPADAAPTIEEVAAVMAQENKSNAGWKILGAAVVGGLGGNLLGQGDKGSEQGLGLGGDKLKTTAIGAAGAAALMTASTQVNNYKAGSVILSTGVNAAAGATAGNLMATGDDILKIDKCPSTVTANNDELCLYGSVENSKAGVTTHYSYDIQTDKGSNIFYDVETKSAYQCQVLTKQREYHKCVSISIMDIEFQGLSYKSNDCVKNTCKDDKKNTYDCVDTNKLTKCADAIKNGSESGLTFWYYDPNIKNEKDKKLIETPSGQTGNYIRVVRANKTGTRDAVVVKIDKSIANKKTFGYKYSDWPDLRQTLGSFKVYSIRDGSESSNNVSAVDFRPSMQSANDGDVIDFNNKARMKSTLIGAGGGAALGAISGAAGADAEINERWLAEQREYEGSLGNIACFTGERYLSQYNSIIELPEMKIPEEQTNK